LLLWRRPESCMAAEQKTDDIAYVTALVREHDRPRYYATLFAPAEARADLFALYGFAAEVARVPDLVSEPGLGEIRLRWWQDSLVEAVGSGGAGGTPTLRAIAATINRQRLPLTAFQALIEARSADLYSDPPATVADVEGHMGETESVLFQMAAIILGARGPETADASGHAGIAYGVARRLAVFASDRARGRSIVPADVLALQGLTSANLFATRTHSNLVPLVEEMVALARQHLGLARDAIGKLGAPNRLAFLPLAVVASALRRIERLGHDVGGHDAHLSDFETLLRTGLARLKGL
jgi:15-cis-phytoene synthase